VLDKLSLMAYVVVVFLLGMLFSFLYWLEEHFADINMDNAKVRYVEGTLHSLIGALIGVIVLSTLLEFYPQLSRLFDAGISVLAAVLVDLVLFVIKRRGEKL